MVPLVLAASFLVYLASPNATGQAGRVAPSEVRDGAPQPPQVVASLRTLLPMIERAEVTALTARDAKLRATRTVQTLLSLSISWPAQSPADYRAHMAKAVRLFELALADGDQEHVDLMMLSLADDLDIKLEHCRMNGGRLGGPILVRVRALRGGLEINDLEVLFLPSLQHANGAPPERFPHVGGTAKMALVPGRYLIWLKDAERGVVGEPTPIKVGEGRRQLDLDLLAP
jgi:hypothetical protein